MVRELLTRLKVLGHTIRAYTSGAFEARQTFPLPTTVPSWYAGHMARAVRSMPYLLARYPPPLVIEARDARLPLTSINPVFEKLLRSAPSEGWAERRLIVYTKRDLIDPQLEKPLREALKTHGGVQDVLFCDTRNDRDVAKVLSWVQKRAKELVDNPLPAPEPKSERAEKRAKSKMSGAFRYTPTPEEGVRLLILGMPNVGKSSLLNALRRVGTGKGKAASTAPTPGHTRKLTGTVRISKQGPSKKTDGPSQAESEAGAESVFTIAQQDKDKDKDRTDPPIYVYDTPGVMIPFLGHGDEGAERALKLAVTAGIKTSLFDVQMLADYLLYRLNLRIGSNDVPPYVTNLPGSLSHPTNSIETLLESVAERAPGTLGPGGVRDLDAAAHFFLQRWRDGKLGPSQLDIAHPDQVDEAVAHHFAHLANLPTKVKISDPDPDASHNQMKKAQKKQDVKMRLRKLREKGIVPGGKPKNRPGFSFNPRGKGKGKGKGKKGKR